MGLRIKTKLDDVSEHLKSAMPVASPHLAIYLHFIIQYGPCGCGFLALPKCLVYVLKVTFSPRH